MFFVLAFCKLLFTEGNVGTGVLDGPKIFLTSIGKNIYNLQCFRTKLPHRGTILFWTIEDAGPYNYNDKFQFIAV